MKYVFYLGLAFLGLICMVLVFVGFVVSCVSWLPVYVFISGVASIFRKREKEGRQEKEERSGGKGINLWQMAMDRLGTVSRSAGVNGEL